MKQPTQKKQNRFYLPDSEKKKPTSFTTTELEGFYMRKLAYINNARSLSEMIVKLCFDKQYRKNFKDISQKEIEKQLLKIK